MIGRVVSDRFKVLSLIARGGMGKVYKAEQAPLGRICALKVLNPKYDGNEEPDFQKRFFLEASTAAKLSHPNTVTIFDYGRDDDADVYYIAMEYIDGQSIHRTLREVGAMPAHRVSHIFTQICRSLREAHNLGVVHRDMKPANVLLAQKGDEYDIVKVLDFGLVKNVSDEEGEDLTKQGLFMGSPKYMAPEQILGNPVSRRTDIYSLGVMVYEMLTGKCPFDRGGSVKTLMAHINDKPPRLSEMNPRVRVPPALEALVMKCLEKDPKDRFQCIEEVLVALSAVEGGAPLTESLRSAPRLPGAQELAAAALITGGPLEDSGVQSADSIPLAMPAPPLPRLTDSGEVSVTPEPMELSEAPTAVAAAEAAPARSGTPRLVVVGIVAAAGIAAIAFLVLRGGEQQPVAPTPTQTTAAESTPVAPKPTVAPTQTAAPKPPPPPPTASASAAPEPERTLQVDSLPQGATVLEDGKVLCEATPCEVVWKGEAAEAEIHKLIIKKRGFLTEEIPVKKAATKADVPLRSPGAAPVKPTKPTPTAPETAKTVPGYKSNPYATD